MYLYCITVPWQGLLIIFGALAHPATLGKPTSGVGGGVGIEISLPPAPVELFVKSQKL